MVFHLQGHSCYYYLHMIVLVLFMFSLLQFLYYLTRCICRFLLHTYSRFLIFGTRWIPLSPFRLIVDPCMCCYTFIIHRDGEFSVIYKYNYVFITQSNPYNNFVYGFGDTIVQIEYTHTMTTSLPRRSCVLISPSSNFRRFSNWIWWAT